MSTRSAYPRLLSLSLPFASISCLDVEHVAVELVEKPAPLMIDDFNDDVDNTVRQPAELSFVPWRCFGAEAFDLVSCDTGPGIEGSIGRTMSFELYDVPDEGRDYRHITLWTESEEALDLTPYGRIAFSASSRPAPGSTPTLTLHINLRCSALGSDVWVTSAVSVAEDTAWHDYQRNLQGTFRQPQWQKDEWLLADRDLIDPKDCLAQVDGVGIELQPDMPDGTGAAGELLLDQLYVE